MVLIEKSFKELNKMTEEVADKFFFARKALLVLNSNDIIKKYDLPYQAYLIKVEKAYSLLNEKQQNLINNEFFYQNYQYWWVGLYSKANFYRLKKLTMLKFLEGIYHA